MHCWPQTSFHVIFELDFVSSHGSFGWKEREVKYLKAFSVIIIDHSTVFYALSPLSHLKRTFFGSECSPIIQNSIANRK
jgi:hypothetical protein